MSPKQDYTLESSCLQFRNLFTVRGKLGLDSGALIQCMQSWSYLRISLVGPGLTMTFNSPRDLHFKLKKGHDTLQIIYNLLPKHKRNLQLEFRQLYFHMATHIVASYQVMRFSSVKLYLEAYMHSERHAIVQQKSQNYS